MTSEIGRIEKDPIFTPHQIKQNTQASSSHSFVERISDVYQLAIQDFSQFLFRKGWVISSLMIPSIFGEPLETLKSAIRRIIGWKSTWDKNGFFDAADSKSLNKLIKTLEQDESLRNQTPVLLFHGVFSTPDIWLPWADQLKKAKEKKKIGHIITLQLPNNLKERMKVVYKAIDNITQIYQKANGQKEVQVDLIGHSLGGYAGHLAAFLPEEIEIEDEKKIERRWHSTESMHRNPKVRKVISIAAPTWLCCKGMHDETTICKPEKQDIYPWKAFTEKNIEKAFTNPQINTIQKHHDNIYDIVATQDAISSTISPLPKNQVFHFKLGHLGVATNQKVCKKAISILSKSYY